MVPHRNLYSTTDNILLRPLYDKKSLLVHQSDTNPLFTVSCLFSLCLVSGHCKKGNWLENSNSVFNVL